PRAVAWRGGAARAACDEVAACREHVDAALARLLDTAPESELADIVRILEIGLHHEQQHQELLLTDILHAFAQNPIAPVYDSGWRMPHAPASHGEFADLPGGIPAIGFTDEGYSFDNEGPAHQ